MKALLQKTFENEFNDSNYRDLILNLFNRFDFSKEHTLRHQLNEAEKQALNDFIYLGTFEDSQNKSLDVLTVALKGGSKVERARSLQRNLIGKYLKNNLKDSALVAFYSKDNLDWRLSFVKVDYRLDDKGAKVEIGTPPKRFSFLVGETEPSHSAQKQLLPLLDDKKIPLVDEIEKSFSIEKVTKEFYTEIAKKFTELVGGERKIGSKKIIEAGFLKYPKPSDILRKEFAVRLIGRLMFSWFLKKKKSEVGIPLIPNVILSSDAIRQYPDYYHSLLEPLFFQVLNTLIEKRDKNVRHNFWNNIPFLNGGLFEPHLYDYYEIYYESGISKYINTLKIPDEWFLNLFKIFEIYNFTIDESTTIDIDISVDPEMLGRIFENLLAEINPETGETARKSTGSYYTPRPIVEYMVDESLKQYLLTQISINKNVIARSVSDEAISRDEIATPSARNDNNEVQFEETKISKLLSYSGEEVDLTEEEKDLIIDALDRLKIIDPACGSGAFPMGILHKMLLILQKIDPESKKWLTRKLARIDNEILRTELEKKLKTENWDYVHKLGIIQNSIYGVDIQPIAVEISKLRFFLSLIVDEKIDDGKPNRGVVPLPNLEFKFVAANSLIGLPKGQIDMFEAHEDIKKLKELRDSYFNCYGDEKRSIEHEFERIQGKMIEYAQKEMVTHKKTLTTQTLELSKWKPFSDETSSWFDPEWMFGIKNPSPLAGESNPITPSPLTGEGKGEGGFDIVIANPPYVSHVNYAKAEKELLSRCFETFKERADIYVAFYEKGIQLLKSQGHLAFITPNKFFRSSYGKALRKYLLSNTRLITIIDFGDTPIFEATTYPAIIVLEKTVTSDETYSFRVLTISTKEQLKNLDSFIDKHFVSIENVDLSEDIWFLERPEVLRLIKKLKNAGILLSKYVSGKIFRGIVTGLNEAFIIDANTKSELISKNHEVSKIIKPFLQGKEIKKWHAKSSSYIIFANHGIDIERYPEITEYLRPFKAKLEQRATSDKHKWYELQQPQTGIYQYFEKDKITWGNLATEPKFAFDATASYVSAPANIIPTTDLFLLAVLNSPLCKWLISLQAAVRSGGFLEYKPMYVETIPVVQATDKQKTPIIKLVESILSAPDSPNVPHLEAEINKLVYALYDLTPEEIAIVEEDFNH